MFWKFELVIQVYNSQNKVFVIQTNTIGKQAHGQQMFIIIDFTKYFSKCNSVFCFEMSPLFKYKYIILECYCLIIFKGLLYFNQHSKKYVRLCNLDFEDVVS